VFGPSRAEVLEGIDGDTIQRVIRRYLNQIRYCYQAVGLPNNPRLQGEIKVAFLIGPMGTVLRTEMVSSSLGNGPTEQCVLAQIRTWRFPKTGGRTAYVVYPFRFRPSGAR
jgi:TonB family protein